jgi:hypothetical protein
MYAGRHDMVSLHIWDNQAPAWVATAHSSNFEIGMSFISTTGGYVTALRWYRPDTAATSKPIVLRLWDSTNATVAATAPSIPDNGAVGWQEVALTNVVALQPGRKYYVTAQWPTGNKKGQVTSSADPGPLYPLSVPTFRAVFTNAGSYGFPNNGDNKNWYGVDIVWTDQGGAAAPAGATNADVQNDLAGALSVSDNTHHDWLPWTTKSVLDALAAKVGSPGDTDTSTLFGKYNDWAAGLGADAHGYFATIKGLIGDIKTVTDTLPSPINRLTSIVLDHYTGDINTILSRIDSVLPGATAATGGARFNQDVLAGRAGFPAGTPNTAWTQVDTVDFDTQLAWAVAADQYVVNITAVRPGQSVSSFGGLVWYYRLGSWCVLNGSLGSTRRFLEFQSQVLDDGGRRMPGLAIRCQPGTIGTVQAWTLG